MDPLSTFFISCFAGTICAFVAKSKGRNAFGWFCCGFFFTIIGLIIIIAISDLKVEKQRLTAQLEVNRRLREQSKRDQQKIESLQRHALSRLDMHDAILGVDTVIQAPPLNPNIMLGHKTPVLEVSAPPRLSSHTVRPPIPE